MRYLWSDLSLFKYEQAIRFRNKHIFIHFSASVINDMTMDAMLCVGEHILGNAVSGQIWRYRS